MYRFTDRVIQDTFTDRVIQDTFTDRVIQDTFTDRVIQRGPVLVSTYTSTERPEFKSTSLLSVTEDSKSQGHTRILASELQEIVLNGSL
ncbi:hypothetical protein BgiBS90_004624, partial [Biomphalaria glabrata]